MTKEQFVKLNLADGFAIGTFQKFTKALGKKSNKPYGRLGILIGSTVHEFFDNVPEGVTTLDAYKGPGVPVGTVMVIHQPEFNIDFSGGKPRLQVSCSKIEALIDK
jgi:hypothetical protein